MEIIRVIGIGLTALVSIIILKQYKPEFSIYVSLAAGAIILFMVMDKLSSVITLLTNITTKTSTNSEFLGILLKITGISILTEYAVSICKDSGETAIASKVDLGGKVIIIAISIPIITAVLELLIKILP